jgi:hypothetical protein
MIRRKPDLDDAESFAKPPGAGPAFRAKRIFGISILGTGRAIRSRGLP